MEDKIKEVINWTSDYNMDKIDKGDLLVFLQSLSLQPSVKESAEVRSAKDIFLKNSIPVLLKEGTIKDENEAAAYFEKTERQEGMKDFLSVVFASMEEYKTQSSAPLLNNSEGVEERLIALKVLNKHFAKAMRFEHLEDEQVKLVLDAMEEYKSSSVKDEKLNKWLNEQLDYCDCIHKDENNLRYWSGRVDSVNAAKTYIKSLQSSSECQNIKI